MTFTAAASRLFFDRASNEPRIDVSSLPSLRTGKRPSPPALRSRSGAVVILVVVMLPVFLLMTAFAINMAYMELCRTELQISTDAAARAGGRTYSRTGDMGLARDTSRNAANRNRVAGEPLSLADSDLEFGVSTRTQSDARYQFEPDTAPYNSLRVTGRRTTGSVDGAIRLLMPNFLGVSDFEIHQRALSTQVELDVAVVVDRSGSMAYAANEISATYDNPSAALPGWQFGDAVPNPSRWRDAVMAVSEFLNVLEQTPLDEQVALCTYGNSATINVPLTTNYSAILGGMNFYTSSFHEAMTNIGGGINSGRTALNAGPTARPWAAKVIVVLTDGIHNTGTNPMTAANLAKTEGTTIYSVTFSNEANQTMMKNVANATKGKHYHAVNSTDLITAFQDIAKSLPTLLVE